MKILGNIDVDLDVVNKDYVDGKIKNIELTPGPKGDDGLNGKDGKSINVWHGTADEFESVEKQDGTLYLIKE